MISAKQSLLDQLIVSGSNFLVIVLAARLLSLEGVAKYAYGFGIYMMVYMLANAWVYQNIMTISKDKLASEGGVSSFAGLNIILVALFIPISIFTFVLITPDKLTVGSWLDAALVSLFVAASQLIDFERRIRYFTDCLGDTGPVAVSSVGYIFRLGGLVVIAPDNFTMFMQVLLVFSSPGLYFSFQRLKNGLGSNLTQFCVKQIRAGGWMTINIPINWCWGQAPVYLVGIFVGLPAAGVFAAIRSIANAANVAMEMIPTFCASRLSFLYTTGRIADYYRFILKSTVFGITVWAVGLAFLILFGDKLLIVVMGKNFIDGSDLLLLFWICNVLTFINRIQNIHSKFIDRTVFVPVSNLIGVATLVLIYFTRIEASGVESMAYAMIGGGVSITILQAYFARYYSNKHT